MLAVPRASFLALLLFQWVASVPGAQPAGVITFKGQRYVSLQDWCKARDWSFRWDKADRVVTVNSQWTRISFEIYSRKCTYNGAVLWLTSPVTLSGNTVLLPERDLIKTIHPILYPKKAPRKIRTVVIAPGHGGKDPGYQINKDQEKKYTLMLARAVKAFLVKAGFKVILTRETDKFVDLADQAALANRHRADLFVSLHYNAAVDTAANGVETYCLTPAGATSTNGGQPVAPAAGHRQDEFNPLLAFHLHRALVDACGLEDRGIRRAAFQVLREVNMPAVLIEGGFLSNPRDALKIKNATQRNAVARAIADGLAQYRDRVERR